METTTKVLLLVDTEFDLVPRTALHHPKMCPTFAAALAILPPERSHGHWLRSITVCRYDLRTDVLEAPFTVHVQEPPVWNNRTRSIHRLANDAANSVSMKQAAETLAVLNQSEQVLCGHHVGNDESVMRVLDSYVGAKPMRIWKDTAQIAVSQGHRKTGMSSLLSEFDIDETEFKPAHTSEGDVQRLRVLVRALDLNN
jgi:hypothetical protein